MTTQRVKQKSTESAHALIGRKCVNNCIFCAVALKREQSYFPSYEEILQFINDSKEAGITRFVLSGLGEPTMDPHLELYIETAKKAGYEHICLFTNGHRVTEEKADEWENLGVTQVLVSLHGLREGHDKNVQRSGSFDEAVNALEIFSKFSYEINVNTCLTVHNINEIPGLNNFIARYPVRTHTLSFPEWSGNALRNKEQLLNYSDIYRRRAQLIPEKGGITRFENVPYCIIRRNTVELFSSGSSLLIDGNGVIENSLQRGKMFPKICSDFHCRYRTRCSGFESEYIRTRGWRDSLPIVKRFLLRNKNYSGYFNLGKGIRSSKKDNDSTKTDGICVILKPTYECNGSCTYCSAVHKDHPKTSSASTQINILKRLHEYISEKELKNPLLIWHGGEPLLMGKDFFKKVQEYLVSEYPPALKQNIQTNMLTLDAEWIDLFKQYKIRISSSVDPVSKKLRTWKDGLPQLDTWLGKFFMLTDNDYPLGLVFTVSREHLGQEEKIYSYFRNLQSLSRGGIAVRFNPIYPSGRSENAYDLLIREPDYGKFLWKLWELWDRDLRPFNISPFTDFLDPHKHLCEFSKDCSERFLGIDGEGNVSNCGRTLDSKILFGNVFTDSWEDILDNEERKTMSGRSDVLKTTECLSCEFWELCYGGCPYTVKLYTGGYLNKSPFCESYKYFFNKIRNEVLR